MSLPVNEETLVSTPTVAVLGLGLMGASFAGALKDSGAAEHIIGYDINEAHTAHCMKHKLVHAVAQNAANAVSYADIVVLAAPISALPKLAKEIAPHLREGAVVTDMASVKASTAAAVATELPNHAHYVPAHPIAGKSSHGPEAADKRMFRQKLAILSPEKDAIPDHAVAAITRLWEAVGAHPERMSATNHDVIYAYVSHLPQMLAYASAQTLTETALPAPDKRPESFRRFTRLGSSDPKIWTEIALANREPLAHALEHVLATVSHMQQEFAEGVAKGEASQDHPEVGTRFFPMIISAALISVVSQFEIQNNVRLSSYAGSGMVDFTAPAGEEDPAKLFEQISKSHAQVNACLGRFRQHLEVIHEAVKSGDEQGLLAALTAGHDAHSPQNSAPKQHGIAR